jgi:hypothetical protein
MTLRPAAKALSGLASLLVAVACRARSRYGFASHGLCSHSCAAVYIYLVVIYRTHTGVHDTMTARRPAARLRHVPRADRCGRRDLPRGPLRPRAGGHRSPRGGTVLLHCQVCHWLSFLRDFADLHSNLAVMAVTFSRNDRVVPG